MKNFIGSRAIPDLVYHCPENMEQLMDLLGHIQGHFKIVAGCTDFIPAVRGGRWAFDDGLELIDIKKIPELKYVTLDGDRIRIGGATPLSMIIGAPAIKERAPGLAHGLTTMASPQVRNVGTIGGNICMSSPAADAVPSLLVLDAQVIINGNQGEEKSPLDRFFLGPGRNIMAPDQVLTEINFPAPAANESQHFQKVGTRDAVVISIVSAASWLKVDNGKCQGVRIAMGSVAPTPVRLPGAEALLVGNSLTLDAIDACAKHASQEITPITDLRGSADYRRDLAYTLTKRTLTACMNDLM
ncbi:MAG: xanthine dehydrogenase family protein subunit M [Desulfobacterium sp.]|nr:xanthine dehydrogenase family protein subunit M [Desulfobacterium sp.]